MAPLELCFRRGPLRRLPVGRSEAPFEGPAPFAIYVRFYKSTVSSARSEKKSRRFLQRHGGIESCREERPRDLRPFFLRCRRLLASPPASSSRSHAPFRLIRWTAANATSNPSQSNALNVSRDCAPHTSQCASRRPRDTPTPLCRGLDDGSSAPSRVHRREAESVDRVEEETVFEPNTSRLHCTRLLDAVLSGFRKR